MANDKERLREAITACGEATDPEVREAAIADIICLSANGRATIRRAATAYLQAHNINCGMGIEIEPKPLA